MQVWQLIEELRELENTYPGARYWQVQIEFTYQAVSLVEDLVPIQAAEELVGDLLRERTKETTQELLKKFKYGLAEDRVEPEDRTTYAALFGLSRDKDEYSVNCCRLRFLAPEND